MFEDGLNGINILEAIPEKRICDRNFVDLQPTRYYILLLITDNKIPSLNKILLFHNRTAFFVASCPSVRLRETKKNCIVRVWKWNEWAQRTSVIFTRGHLFTIITLIADYECRVQFPIILNVTSERSERVLLSL